MWRTSGSCCPLIFPCTANKSISNLRKKKPDGPLTTHYRPGCSQGLLGYCTTRACSSPLKTYTFNKQLNEWLKGTNKLLRLCSDQCLCFHSHQRHHPVWYAPPTPWSEPCTGRGEEQSIEKRESHVVASLSPGSRVVNPVWWCVLFPWVLLVLISITRHVIYWVAYWLNAFKENLQDVEAAITK